MDILFLQHFIHHGHHAAVKKGQAGIVDCAAQMKNTDLLEHFL